MKKLLALILGACFATATIAATVEIGPEGRLRATNPTDWHKTDATVTPEALAFGDVWQEAYKKPGVTVPVKTHSEPRRDGLFHIITTTVIDEGIVYNVADKKIDIVRAPAVSLKTEKKFTPFVVFWGISVVATTVFVILAIRRTRAVATTTAGVAIAFAAAIAIAIAFAFAVATTTAGVAIAFAVATTIAADSIRGWFVLWVVVYYAIMIGALWQFLAM